MKRVMFVCTGNTCRSPMAAALFNRYAREKGLDAAADSAGLAAMEGAPASAHAVAAMAEVGEDISSHAAKPVTRELLSAADRICCMSESAAAFLRESGFDARTLGTGISDPYGGTLEDYRRCRDEIAAAIPGAAEGL